MDNFYSNIPADKACNFPGLVMLDQSICHLAPGAAMGANEEYSFNCFPLLDLIEQRLTV